MNRRGFLTGLLAAPAVITTPGLLMPVRAWAEPVLGNPDFVRFENCYFSGIGRYVVGDNVHSNGVEWHVVECNYPNTPSVSATAFRSYSVDECP